MPIYEYVCRHCGHELESLQKISDAPLTACPACGEEQLKKRVSAAGFRLKGGGWYETDFKAGRKRNVAGGEDGAQSSEDKGKPTSDNGGDKKAEGTSADSKSGGDGGAKSDGGKGTSDSAGSKKAGGKSTGGGSDGGSGGSGGSKRGRDRSS